MPLKQKKKTSSWSILHKLRPQCYLLCVCLICSCWWHKNKLLWHKQKCSLRFGPLTKMAAYNIKSAHIWVRKGKKGPCLCILWLWRSFVRSENFSMSTGRVYWWVCWFCFRLEELREFYNVICAVKQKRCIATCGALLPFCLAVYLVSVYLIVINTMSAQ